LTPAYTQRQANACARGDDLAPSHPGQAVRTTLVGSRAEAVSKQLNGTLALSKDELADEASPLCLVAADALSTSTTIPPSS
jgi:hypothetical protein